MTLQKTHTSNKVSSTPLHFSLVFCPQTSRLQFCSLGHIPNLVSHTSPSLLPDWFSHSPGPLPATTAMQLSPVSFIVGLRTGLLWLRIELRESFAGSGRALLRVYERMNSWLGKHLNYMGMWNMCAWSLQGVVHGSDWPLLQRKTLVHVLLVRPCDLATPGSRSYSGSFKCVGFKTISYCSVLLVYMSCIYFVCLYN